MRGKHVFFIALAAAAAVAIACGSSNETDGANGADSGTAADAAEVRNELTACRAYIGAQCKKDIACTPGAAGAEDRCLAYLDLCPDFYFSPGSTRTIDGLFQCASEIEAMACDAYLGGERPAACGPGTRKPGEGCRFNSQCESQRCGTNLVTGTCGTCIAVAKTGDPCGGEVQCDYNAYCDSSNRCVAFTSSGGLGVGAVCDNQGRSCRAGLGCVAPSPGATEGTCAELPGPGASCKPSVGFAFPLCATGAFCKPAGDGGTGTCTAALPNGQPCGDPSPYPGDVCREGVCVPPSGGGTPTCSPYSEPNESCTPPRQCNAKTAYCVDNVCRALPKIGESCAAAPCGEGSCTVEESGARCYAKPNPGGVGDPCNPPFVTCRTYLECNSGTCRRRDLSACDEKRD
jgi:hypothetical protein